MLAVIQAYLDIALRRRGPEDLPDSRLLLALTLVVYLILQLVSMAPWYGLSARLAGNVTADLLLQFCFIQGLLWVTGHRARFRQTFTALLGTGSVLLILLVPLQFWTQHILNAGGSPATPQMLQFGIVIWSVFIFAHIAARALSVNFAIGVVLALINFLMSFMLAVRLAPPPAS